MKTRKLPHPTQPMLSSARLGTDFSHGCPAVIPTGASACGHLGLRNPTSRCRILPPPSTPALLHGVSHTHTRTHTHTHTTHTGSSSVPPYRKSVPLAEGTRGRGSPRTIGNAPRTVGFRHPSRTRTRYASHLGGARESPGTVLTNILFGETAHGADGRSQKDKNEKAFVFPPYI